MGVAVLHAPTGPLRGRLRRAWSDERLVARIRAGDDAAFEALYDRYHRDLLAFCRHMLGALEEAEDALQHTFLQAYRVLRADDRPVQPRAWLFAVARNRCLSVLRARREHADLDETTVATEGLTAAVQRRDDLRALVADLQRLPEAQRAALVLAELGAHSHDEIATVLEIRPEKVKALVFQARESLMHFREGREADCTEIRQQLATLRGGALRRNHIRRHLDVCPGCRAFREEVRRQRVAMAAVLPVAPSMALKGSVLGAILGGGGGAAAGGAGALGASGIASKALVVLCVAGGAGAGGFAAVDAVRPHDHRPPALHESARAAPAKRAAATTARQQAAAVVPVATVAAPVARRKHKVPRRAKHHRGDRTRTIVLGKRAHEDAGHGAKRGSHASGGKADHGKRQVEQAAKFEKSRRRGGDEGDRAKVPTRGNAQTDAGAQQSGDGKPPEADTLAARESAGRHAKDRAAGDSVKEAPTP